MSMEKFFNFLNDYPPSEAFNSGNWLIFDVPLEGKILRQNITVDGNIVLSAGSTSGVLNGEGGPANLIKRIKVIAVPADGSRYPTGDENCICDATPRELLREAIAHRSPGVFKVDNSSTMVLGSGAAATYAVHMVIPIHWADPNRATGFLTALNADPKAYKSIQVRVQCGAVTDCFTGNDRTVDYSGLKVYYTDERKNIPGDTYVLIQKGHATQIPAAKDDFVDKAMPDTGVLLSWLLLTESTAANTLVDTILDEVTIDVPKVYGYKQYAKDIQNRMVEDGWYAYTQATTGQFYMDFSDVNLGGGIAGIPANLMLHKLDVNNPGTANLDTLRSFTRRVFAPRDFNAQEMK